VFNDLPNCPLSQYSTNNYSILIQADYKVDQSWLGYPLLLARVTWGSEIPGIVLYGVPEHVPHDAGGCVSLFTSTLYTFVEVTFLEARRTVYVCAKLNSIRSLACTRGDYDRF
jgi:hypothetical protein